MFTFPPAPCQPGSPRVVIADDDLVYAETIGNFLGYEDEIEIVGCASDAQEALALVALHRPDVLVIDVELTWSDAFRAIHAIGELASTRLVLLSETSCDADEDQATALGAPSVGKTSVTDDLIPAILAVTPAARAASAGVTA